MWKRPHRGASWWWCQSLRLRHSSLTFRVWRLVRFSRCQRGLKHFQHLRPDETPSFHKYRGPFTPGFCWTIGQLVVAGDLIDNPIPRLLLLTFVSYPFG